MDFEHYNDAPVRLAVELVNAYGTQPRAADGRTDTPLPDPEVFLARWRDEVSTDTPADPLALQALADRLFVVFASPDEQEAVDVVNALLCQVQAQPRVSGHDGHTWHLHYTCAGAGALDQVTATAAMGLATVLCDYGKARLGACDATSCRDVFVDTSRNCSRRYCSDGCSNRANIAAFRARQRGHQPKPM